MPVITGTATETEDIVRITAVGSGEAIRAATLRPAVAGEVARVEFVAGQAVRAGETLVRLDERHERLAVDLAGSRVDAARRLLDRYANTRDTGAVSATLVDEARTRLRDAEIALDQARVALADRSIRAPFDGTVGIARVQVGDRVTTDTVVTTIDDRRVIRIAFHLPEAYIGRVDVDHRIDASNVSEPDTVYPGRVVQIDSRVDPVDRAVRVLADVRNRDDRLRPGMSFELRLVLSGDRLVSLPELALQWGPDGSFVWTIRDGRAQRVPVRLVRRSDARVLVVAGGAADRTIANGDHVVVEGVHRLDDGRQVRVVEHAGPPDA